MSSKPGVVALLAATFLLLPDGAAAQARTPKEAACRVQAGQQGLQGRKLQQFLSTCLGTKPAARSSRKKAAAAKKKAAAQE